MNRSNLLASLLLASVTVPGCIVGADASDPGMSLDEFTQKFVHVEIDAASGTQRLLYDWDQPLASMDQVKQLHDAYVRAKTGGETISEATVNLTMFGGVDVWSAADRTNLTYCVSDGFGGYKGAMVQAMAEATSAWYSASNGAVQYVYHPEHDASCTNANGAVVFNVIPTAVDGGGVIASAFFPSWPRDQRQLLVYTSVAFTPGQFPLAGILRHELGHSLGLRHETARTEAIAAYGFHCFENVFFRTLTGFDDLSVMVTPACVGDALENTQLVISALDAQGIQNLYH